MSYRFFIVSMLASLLILSNLIYAQNQEDVLRYSSMDTYGTARSLSMGNAFGALGGDFTSLSINPAGIGVFRKSEISFSPELMITGTSSKHYDNNSFDVKAGVSVNNIGFVGAFETDNQYTGWLNVNVGFGYNQLKDFGNNILIHGINNESSLIDTYVDHLNNYSVDIIETIHTDPNFYQGSNLAWQNYLIDYDTTAQRFYRSFELNNNIQQSSIKERGRMNETVLSIGANHSNKWYIGATIGSINVDFKNSTSYSEVSGSIDSSNYFTSFTLHEDLKTTGRGWNVKLGAIYRPVSSLRIGIAYHSPTLYSLKDSWSTQMTANFTTITLNNEDPDGVYKYGMITPGKIIFSGAGILKKRGIVSADIELLNFSSARLFSFDNSYDFADENNTIDTMYIPAVNLKLGGEFRIQHIAIRAGYAFFQKAHNVGDNTFNKSTLSLGAGYRTAGFYFDVAYSMTSNHFYYYLYQPNYVEPTQIDQTAHRVTTTLGFRF